ncbi:MAG: hypothetical protein F6K39_21900 [Okeania sp. SIO3B3]|nr:hypothetical protein [Okeania sp. SIO3B3]
MLALLRGGINISGVGILPSQKYQERENIRNGKISGTGKYQERENIRNGKISGTGKYQERENIRNEQDAHSTRL